MWPFNKKKPLIRDQYLRDQGISTKFADAFRYSKSTLREHLAELEQQETMWNNQLTELHSSKRMREMKTSRLSQEASEPDISSTSRKDLIAQLTLLEQQGVQDTKATTEAMQSLKQVKKTRWLLQNILDGTYTNPELIADPPEGGWAGDWEDLFDTLPDPGDLDPTRMKEMMDKFGIKDHSITPDENTSADDDEIDPGV